MHQDSSSNPNNQFCKGSWVGDWGTCWNIRFHVFIQVLWEHPVLPSPADWPADNILPLPPTNTIHYQHCRSRAEFRHVFGLGVICDEKGSKPTTNNEAEFMQVSILIAVIYHNYIIWLWDGEWENKKLVKWASRPLGLVPASPILVRALLTSPIILVGPARYLSFNRDCHSDLIRGESHDTYLCLSRVKWGHYALGVSPLCWEVTIQSKIPEFESLSARLHWNSLWVMLTSMSLFVISSQFYRQDVPLPAG